MTEILFYHLEQSTLERVLPELLEKSLERGWNVIVQAGSEERVDALDAVLWTFREDAFLPHGTDQNSDPQSQPILLTTGTANQNNAQIRFLVDGAEIDDVDQYVRVVFMFDGRDPDPLARAREQWKAFKNTDHKVTYWSQNETGKWEQKA